MSQKKLKFNPHNLVTGLLLCVVASLAMPLAGVDFSTVPGMLLGVFVGLMTGRMFPYLTYEEVEDESKDQKTDS